VTAKRVAFSYNNLGQRTQIARFQSTGTANPVATTDFTFDTANRMSGIAHKQGATNLNTYAYTYDPLSRIATIVSTLDGTDTYSYDQTSQLTGATHTTQANETYGFDANGNRNTAGFTTAVNNRTTAGLGFTYTYDDEGNRTSKTETATGKVEEYSWDYRNRLTRVASRNSTGGAIVRQVDYEYDAFNRLVRRVFDADGAGAGVATNQYWVYDEGINAVLQFDGSAASNLSHRYLWSDNVDELLADEVVTSPSSGGNVLWGLADHLGTIRDIADLNESTGSTSITNHRRFNSFGALVSESNAAVDLLFAYTGKQYDEATGLQHNWFRWYDPALGQWLSEDPLGFAAGDENVRRYVGNGVVDSIDPTGLQEPSGVLTEEQIRLIQEWIKNNTNASPSSSNVQAPTLLQSLPTPPLPGEPVPDRFGNVRCTGTWPTRVPPNPSFSQIVFNVPSRHLTPGEIELLQCVFQGHLNTDGLVVIEGKFPFSQGGNTVTPRYTPWFLPQNYSDDFSQLPGSDWRYGHFIHEMTHVLQSQQGNWNQIDFLYHYFGNSFDYGATYGFDFEQLGQPLYTFNFEQQAQIIQWYMTDPNRIPDDYRRAWEQTLQGFQTQPPGPRQQFHVHGQSIIRDRIQTPLPLEHVIDSRR